MINPFGFIHLRYTPKKNNSSIATFAVSESFSLYKNGVSHGVILPADYSVFHLRDTVAGQ